MCLQWLASMGAGERHRCRWSLEYYSGLLALVASTGRGSAGCDLDDFGEHRGHFICVRQHRTLLLNDHWIDAIWLAVECKRRVMIKGSVQTNKQTEVLVVVVRTCTQPSGCVAAPLWHLPPPTARPGCCRLGFLHPTSVHVHCGLSVPQHTCHRQASANV